MNERLVINDVYRSMKWFHIRHDQRRDDLEENLQKSKDGTYAKTRYWHRGKYDEERNNESTRYVSEEESPPLLNMEQVPSEYIRMIKAASRDVFGIPEPRDF